MLQTRNGKMPEWKWSVLSRGAGSQFIMSVPHGAVSFAVTEVQIYTSKIYIIYCKWKITLMLDNKERIS